MNIRLWHDGILWFAWNNSLEYFLLAASSLIVNRCKKASPVMTRVRAIPAILICLFLFSSGPVFFDEFRAFWADAWHSGFENSGTTQSLVDYVSGCNGNTIILEVRKRADAYYNSPTEPKATSVTPADGYDSLADAIVRSHAAGLELHAWAVTYRVWEGTSGPAHSTPEHLWYQHPEWFMLDDTGNQFAGATTNLDPGVPAVEDYLVNLFLYIVENYDIDGITLDYIRYPGLAWGYNSTSVARFNAEYGRTGNPSSTDTLWQNWRRDQISNLVKRLYLEVKAVKPQVKIGAAVWKTADSGNSGYLQDWDRWMANHWLDYVSPMNYTTDNTTFHNNSADNLSREYGHHVYVAPGSYMNTAANNVTQMLDLQSMGAHGMALYSYAVPNEEYNQSTARSTMLAGPWSAPASIPDMPWLSNPTKGYIKGYVKDASGKAIYPAIVTISSLGDSDKDSGTGFYGFSEVSPGTYSVASTADGYVSRTQTVTVTAGNVSTLNFTLALDTVKPVISNMRAESVQATNALIKWTTDKESTSQVDYGTTSSYGAATTEDLNRVTAHAVQLTGLSPNTTYHFRVRSFDAARNVSVSCDCTFSTSVYDAVGDLITDTGFSSTGSWFVSTSASDKYGASYHWASTSTNANVYCTWSPTIIVAGTYDVYCWYPQGTNRSSQARWQVVYDGGSSEVRVNEQTNGGQWIKIADAKPFIAGTSGYVRTYVATGDTGKVVMADAVKLVYADTTAPSVPANLTASAYSTTQIALSWAGSTDNIGLAGYKIFRNGKEIATTTSNSYIDSNLISNTAYSYYVQAYDLAQNISGSGNTVTRCTLSIAPWTTSITCDKPVDKWQSEQEFTFTAVGGFGAGRVQYYKYAWDRNSTHTFSGSESSWSSGALTVTVPLSGQWYLHVTGYNADNVASGTYTYGSFNCDLSVPYIEGVTADAYADAAGQLSASWTASDDESGIAECQYAVGTTAENLGSVVGWTSTGVSNSATTSGIVLTPGTAYYIGVKAKNGAGTWSAAAVSEKVVAASVVTRIADAKSRPDGVALILKLKPVTANFGESFYMEETDRSSGLKVEATSPEEGSLADVGGILATVNGERVLTLALAKGVSAGEVLTPVFVRNINIGGVPLNKYTPGVYGGIGLNNIGLLIKTAGRVIRLESGCMYIDDGSAAVDALGAHGVKVLTSALRDIPSLDDYIVICGISSTEQSQKGVNRLIKPRRDSDMTSYQNR